MWEERKLDPAIAVAAALLCVAMAMAVAEAKGKEEPVTELMKGFTAAHSAGSSAGFEPVLHAPNGAFAFGFLRVGESSLDLAVVHLPSSFALWRATPARTADWARPATLSFDDGRLALSVPGPGNGAHSVLWSTLNIVGDTVALLNSSDLVIRRYGGNIRTPWRSFDNPSNTLVAGQNFSGESSTPLVSSNRRFALRMEKTFMALHMEFFFNGGAARTRPAYWRYTAREADAQNATQPPVYGRVDIRGFFGLYIEEQSVDMIAFDTFVAKNLTAAFRRMTLEDDGNLRAYYWAEDSKAWVSDYKAITDQCGLPTSCGPYGLCVPGAPAKAQCQCLVNTTDTAAPQCRAEETADLCADGEKKKQVEFEVVRRRRVSVAYKEQLPPETNKTAAECEESCAADCGCWGAVYSGGSGYCYRLDFPVETLVYEEDDQKMGYFKVRKPQRARRRGMSPGATGATVALALVLAGLAVAGAWEGHRRRWRWRRDDGGGVGMEQELTPGSYKDLKSMDSSNNSFKA
ncbi:PAN domain-containing protein At5g03700 [Brachypodium distachyon]|uniref:non-specific serine/threonine protein kinase n=1 Tax=Brachypodium distachyon TaxID=15368 RepID=I1IUE0_BRADI|nr:PAN domain-containing protein At5g03700 [Brachypodium distachyon]KQJ92280.1 hypothetical protein BRADI_4g42640v3 [Brachypodium distachyon]|eukprot:XP_003577053.1 PAN domain-containing protein At5g03700 [Brachypodium distachyon]